jgi:hypothetical protein
MKKIILLLSIILLVSCSSDSNNSPSPSSSNSGVYKWSFKLDGVLYQWSGSLTDPNSNGGSQYFSGNVSLSKTMEVTVNIDLPTVSTGNFTCNSSSNSSFSIGIVEGVGEYRTSYGGTMNVNISSLSSNTFSTNPANPGKVIGTFSGTIKTIGNSLHTVTEGSFEAIRIQ